MKRRAEKQARHRRVQMQMVALLLLFTLLTTFLTGWMIYSRSSEQVIQDAWQQHEALGRSLVQGLQTAGIAVFESGSLQMDLTQTSYSTIPSVDIELGDRAADHSQEACMRYAQGLKAGIDAYFSDAGSAG